MCPDINLSGAFEEVFWVDNIEAAVRFYTNAFDALVVRRDPQVEIKIGCSRIRLCQISTKTRRVGAQFETILQTGDVEDLVNQAESAGAQREGGFTVESTGGILMARLVDPFGFRWLICSLWKNIETEFCVVNTFHGSHIPALCSEIIEWEAKRNSPKVGEAEAARFEDCETSLKNVDRWECKLNEFKASYLVHHQNKFVGSELEQMINEMHANLGIVRASLKCKCMDPITWATSTIRNWFIEVNQSCRGFVWVLPSMTDLPEDWYSKELKNSRSSTAYYIRQFLKDILIVRRLKNHLPRKDLLAMETMLKPMLGEWRHQDTSY